MNISVRFHKSVKDGTGVLHTYDTTLSEDIEMSGLNAEQKVAKVRAVQHFLHREIHAAINRELVGDGIIDADPGHPVVK